MRGFAPFNVVSPINTQINSTTIYIGHVDEVHYVSTVALDNYSATSINESDVCSHTTNSHMDYIAWNKPYFLMSTYSICFSVIKSCGF